jgi:hypothetical protein
MLADPFLPELTPLQLDLLRRHQDGACPVIASRETSNRRRLIALRLIQPYPPNLPPLRPVKTIITAAGKRVLRAFLAEAESAKKVVRRMDSD